ncbi:MAG: recombination regulator RecX [Burkholderiales bacterium]|nr:recombination regulator RecX [Burkholderiales bacterium]
MQAPSKSSKQSPSLKARALRLLSRREYSRKELASKLLQLTQQNIEEPPIDLELQIEAVLTDFEARGWLSDERFAQALVRRRSERYGIRRVTDELQRAGVEMGLITQLTVELKESEYDRAKSLWTRKFGQISSEQKERARQYRFLISKGFSPDLVAKVIGGRKASI